MEATERGRALSHSSVLELLCQASMVWWYSLKPKRWPAEMTPATSAPALPVPHKNQFLWAALSNASPLLCTALTKPLPPPKADLGQGDLWSCSEFW